MRLHTFAETGTVIKKLNALNHHTIEVKHHFFANNTAKLNETIFVWVDIECNRYENRPTAATGEENHTNRPKKKFTKCM